MTNYYHIRMDDFSEHWDTNKIIEFLNESNKFTYNGNGAFNCKSEYCIITLVYTNNFNFIASPNDFDDNKTNYIDIVASCELSSEMMDLLNKLAKYLNSEFVEEE